MGSRPWGTKSWNWGSAIGDAHDAAAVVRRKLGNEKARLEFVQSLKKANCDWLETELCLALVWQQARGRLPAAYIEAYEQLVQGNLKTPAELAYLVAPAIERYCLNVKLSVLPERVDEFLGVIKDNENYIRAYESRNLRYSWGRGQENENEFHFQEQFVQEKGFQAHINSVNFQKWNTFVDSEPFSSPPKVEFWRTISNIADEEPPQVVAAAVLASLDFVENGWL